MKKILLLGDSIRMNYQQATIERFAGSAEIAAPSENCRDTGYTLISLAGWLSSFPNPDIIQWNNGIWDITWFNGEERPLNSLDEYVRDVRRAAHAFKKTGAKLVFALTTPIDENNLTQSNLKNKSLDDVIAYNSAVSEMLIKEGVLINDLYSVIAADPERFLSDDGCHLSEEGKLACAEANYSILAPLASL